MKPVILFSVLILVCCPVFARFDIVDPNGSPLMPGDTLEVTNSDTFLPTQYYSDAWYILYDGGVQLTELHIPFDKQHFTINASYQLEGWAELYVGVYDWADELELKIQLANLPQPVQFTSRNSLAIQPTNEVFPSTTTWGLITLLAGLSLLLFRRK